MSDSVFSNVTIITVCMIIVFTMQRNQPQIPWLISLGMLATVAMLVRPIGFYQAALIAVGVAIWIWSAASSRHVAIRLGLLAVFLLPVVLVWDGYNRWNEHRTGTRFFTTSNFLLLQPVVEAHVKGAAVFDQYPPYAEAYAATANTPCPENPYTHECAYVRAEAMHEYLFRNHGMRPPELARLASSAYASTWIQTPGSQLLYILHEYLYQGCSVLAAGGSTIGIRV